MTLSDTIGALLWTTAFLGTSPLDAAHAQAGPQAEIQPLLDEQLLAANAHDTDRFLATFLHDSTLVLVFNGVMTAGFTAVRDLQLKAWNNGHTDVVYSARAPAVFRVLTPEVVVVTQAMTSRRTAAHGTVATVDFVATSVWQKRPDGWCVVQADESTVR